MLSIRRLKKIAVAFTLVLLVFSSVTFGNENVWFNKKNKDNSSIEMKKPGSKDNFNYKNKSGKNNYEKKLELDYEKPKNKNLGGKNND